MKSELHLVIIWEKAAHYREEIIADLRVHFEVLQVYEVVWSRERFSRNLSRFYGKKLPNGSEKETHCGTGPFTLIVFRDHKVNYGERKTSAGLVHVNTNVFDAKTSYRTWTGGGHKVHATNSQDETIHDLLLLLGMDLYQFESEHSHTWDGSVEKLSTDLIGTQGWPNLESLFSVLNKLVKYVVLRNFDYLPVEYHIGDHGDIDILTDNYEDICHIANAQKVFRKGCRVHYTVDVNGQRIPFDFRYVGDGYYDTMWQRNILESRELSPHGIYVPNDENYFYSLFYHATVHKRKIATDYEERLQKLAHASGIEIPSDIFEDHNKIRSFLWAFLQARGYEFTSPSDLSVFYNEDIVDKKTISFRRKLSNVLGRIRHIVKRKILRVAGVKSLAIENE